MRNIKKVLILLLLLLPVTLRAQKVLKVTGEYVYYAPSSVTLDQAKQIALDRAKVQLIADEFGTIVGSTNITRIENTNGSSDIQMLTLGESEVKGEWLETIGNPIYEIGYENDMLFVKVSISGRIREVVSATIDVKAKLLRNGTEDKFEGYEFRTGDDMFLSFRSPADGYLTVYLYDGEDTVFCLLPYQNQLVGQIPISANRQYLFFSCEKHQDIPVNLVDEYVLTTSKDIELNRMYVIFSPNHFSKAVDQFGGTVETPRMLSWGEFQKWMSKCRRQDTQMIVNVKDIVIRK